jgi:hypothetical protein
MPFIDTRGLADRWLCTTRKIEQQRQSGEGPAYIKIGRQVLYSDEAIREYEAENTFYSTSEQVFEVSSKLADRRTREGSS